MFSDKREHLILIFWGNKHNISTIMQFFCILVCFSSVLVHELRICNVMWSLQKYFCIENMQSLPEHGMFCQK